MKAKTVFTAAAVSLALAGSVSAQEVSGEMEELSYKMGYDLGRHIQQMGIEELNLEVFQRGMANAMAGEESILTPEQDQRADQMRMAKQQELMDKQRQELAAKSEKNAEAGKAFLAENADKEGVMVTDSGLQYKVVEMGEGPRPAATDTVKVHYSGTLLDGTEFDSSYSRGEPATFPLNRVISGWTEGLQLMPVGSKFMFYIPSELAYGGRSTGNIGPNSTLTFQVELLEIVEQ